MFRPNLTGPLQCLGRQQPVLTRVLPGSCLHTGKKVWQKACRKEGHAQPQMRLKGGCQCPDSQQEKGTCNHRTTASISARTFVLLFVQTTPRTENAPVWIDPVQPQYQHNVRLAAGQQQCLQPVSPTVPRGPQPMLCGVLGVVR